MQHNITAVTNYCNCFDWIYVSLLRCYYLLFNCISIIYLWRKWKHYSDTWVNLRWKTNKQQQQQYSKNRKNAYIVAYLNKLYMEKRSSIYWCELTSRWIAVYGLVIIVMTWFIVYVEEVSVHYCLYHEQIYCYYCLEDHFWCDFIFIFPIEQFNYRFNTIVSINLETFFFIEYSHSNSVIFSRRFPNYIPIEHS